MCTAYIHVVKEKITNKKKNNNNKRPERKR